MNSEHLAGESTEIKQVSITTRGSGAFEKISSFAEQHSGSAVAGIIEYSDVEKQEAEQRKEEQAPSSASRTIRTLYREQFARQASTSRKQAR